VFHELILTIEGDLAAAGKPELHAHYLKLGRGREQRINRVLKKSKVGPQGMKPSIKRMGLPQH
jgi:hypothetical protein